MEGTTLCLNIDLFLLFSPFLRSLVTPFYSLHQLPRLFLPDASLSSLMALESLLCKGVSKEGVLAEVVESAAQLGIKIEALVKDVDKGGAVGTEGGGEIAEKSIIARSVPVPVTDNDPAGVNQVCNVGTDHLADPPTGVNGIASKRKSTCASGRIDEETDMLKQAAPPAGALEVDNTVKGTSISTVAAQQAMDRVMNAGVSKAPPFSASATQLDTPAKEASPVVAPTPGGVVSVEVYGADEEEEGEGVGEKQLVEVKSEPVEVDPAAGDLQGQAGVEPSANIVNSDKRKEAPSFEADEVKLKKKKLLDVVLQNLSDKKSAGVGEESKRPINALKDVKPKRKMSDTSGKPLDKTRKMSDSSGKPLDKTVKEKGSKPGSQQGRRASLSTAEKQAMDRVVNTAGSKNKSAAKAIKGAEESASVKVASSPLVSRVKVGGGSSDDPRRKSEPSSTTKASSIVNKKPQSSKLSTQGKKKQRKPDDPELIGLKSKKELALSSSMENLNQMPGLTITASPSNPSHTITSDPLPVVSNLPPLPVITSEVPASTQAVIVGIKPSDATLKESKGDEGIPQKLQAEDDKGCNYSLTCELCQKENKTLQALYSHIIIHIRVELERKVQDLMEGLQCKVCDQVFKAKAPLLAHIGCKHGKVNDILREKGYNVLPCLLATNSKSGAEMQANLVQIKKEKANMLAE